MIIKDGQMINTSTDLYCILGNPVAHSKSPLLHNTGFEIHGVNAAYLAFEPRDIGQAAAAIRALGIKGASVTIPFKVFVMEHLDWIDEKALAIGAVNTIVNEDGRLLGYNTDYKAAVDPLKPFGLEGKKVLILGAGGAAKAVAFGVWEKGARVVVANRTEDRGRRLADRYKGGFVSPEDMARLDVDIVINTTSLGMAPRIDARAFPEHLIRPEMVVMDVVYTPLDTRLISQARKKGCATIDGLSMFLAQAAAQFSLWTGISLDTDLVRRTIYDNINEPNEQPKGDKTK